MTLTSPAQTAAVQVLPLAKDLDENKVTPGVLGFIVFAVMGVAVWMLMKSMHRHMQKVDFEEEPAGEPTAPGGTPAAEEPAASASASASPGPSSSAAPRDGKGSGPGA
jgi:hypothetical protein